MQYINGGSGEPKREMMARRLATVKAIVYSAYPVIGITSDRHNGATFFGSLGGGQDQIIPSFRIGIFCLPFHGGLDASSSDDTQKHPDFQNFSRKRCMKFLVLPLT